MKIKIENLGKLPLMDYREFNILQGNLKEMEDEGEKKLIKSFKKYGFFLPFVIWIDKKKKIWTLDGNGRYKTMMKNDIQNESGGYEFPVWEVSAKTRKEAAEKILIISSEFHTKSKSGYIDFLNEFKIDMSWANENAAFATSFSMSYDDDLSEDEVDDFFNSAPSEGEGGDQGADLDASFSIILNYTEDEYREVKEGLLKIARTPEDAVFKLLGIKAEI